MSAEGRRRFPFTAREGPRVPGADPTIPTRSAIVRIETGTARLVYAIGLPLTGPAKEISVAADGTVVTTELSVGTPSPSQRMDLREIRPDGMRRRIPVILPVETQTRRAIATSDGGFWIAGTTPGGLLPATPNAWRQSSLSFSYTRWEGPPSITPPGPIRSLLDSHFAHRDTGVMAALQ